RSTLQHYKAIAMELGRVLQAYEHGTLSAEGSMTDALHLMAERIHKRSLVLVFSDLFEVLESENAFFDAMQHLKYNKHEVIVFWTTDHSTELNFSFEERPYRFVDMESGKQVKMN